MEEQVAVLVEQPNFGEIKDLKKSGLLYMAEKLNLTVSRRMLKGQLLETESKLEMAKLEAEKQRLEMQNRQKQLELDTQQQMLEAQNQQKQLEIEAQNQLKRVELEAQSRKIEAQLQLEKVRRQQLEIQQSIAINNNRLEEQRIAAGHGDTKHLKCIQQIPEAHRQKFIGIKRAHDQTISDFARVKINHFDRWSNVTPKVLQSHIEVAKEKLQRTNEATNNYHQILLPQNASGVNASEPFNEVCLPAIDLPHLQGRDDENFECYWNTSDSLVNSKNSINKTKKFLYLRSTLKGESKAVIDHLNQSNDDYDTAIQLLEVSW
nr:GRIP and coiled-coil domain-containing protein C27D7.02c-like [Procambarus clarkii]